MKIIRNFLDEVVQPNMQLSQEEPGDLRATVNAVLTLDALAGVLYSAMRHTGHPTVAAMATDDTFRDHLAENCREFRVLRDLAAAYKHGELTKPKPRLIRGPEHVSEIENQLGIMECGDPVQSTVLMIELIDGQRLRASHAIGTSYQLLQPMVLEIAP